MATLFSVVHPFILFLYLYYHCLTIVMNYSILIFLANLYIWVFSKTEVIGWVIFFRSYQMKFKLIQCWIYSLHLCFPASKLHSADGFKGFLMSFHFYFTFSKECCVFLNIPPSQLNFLILSLFHYLLLFHFYFLFILHWFEKYPFILFGFLIDLNLTRFLFLLNFFEGLKLFEH